MTKLQFYYAELKTKAWMASYTTIPQLKRNYICQCQELVKKLKQARVKEQELTREYQIAS